MAVVTSSVPRGGSSGRGGGTSSARWWVWSGGEPGRTAVGPCRGAGFAPFTRVVAARFGAARFLAAARGAPMRSGRVAGSVPSTLRCSGVGFALAFGPFSAIGHRVYAWIRRDWPLIMFMTDTTPDAHARPRAGYETGPQLRVE